jgi:protein involved in polysaccharide export with SLBB domain
MRVSLAAVLLVLVACGGPPPETRALPPALPPTPDRTALLQGALLGVGDVVEVRVYEEKELSGLFRVAADGSFQYPLVGRVPALGMTPGALSEHLTERLKQGFLRSPQVTVFVKESNSKKIFVLGEVQKPGTFPFENSMTVVQAITLAGGFKDLADKNRTVVTRVVDGTEKKFVVPVEAIGLGREQNVLLQPGDIVFVPETWL